MALSETPNWTQLSVREWQDFISNPALIGRDIELDESGALYRGPIERVEIVNDYISFYTSWTAVYRGNGRWQRLDSSSDWGGLIKNISLAQEAGSIFLSVLYVGRITIYSANCHIEAN